MSTATRPRTFATVTGSSATFTTPDGRSEKITATRDDDIRHAVVQRATDAARRTGAPVELVTSGDRGSFHLLVSADGGLTELGSTPAADATPSDWTATDLYGREVREQAPQPSAVDAPSAPVAEPPTRPTFLDSATSEHTQATGWRVLLQRLGVKPTASERKRAEASALVARHWGGCRTIAVVNGKGGVGKTMTTAMLAAAYARIGGGNVLAWDNNDTRGTLGWRTEQGQHDTTLRDLLRSAEGLLERSAGVSDVSRFVHHQSSDRYDVLRSNPELLATDQRIAATEFDLLMRVAARYYRLVIFDSGNDESAERWLRMVDSSYQLVLPTLAAPESAESAALLLDALRNRDERSAALASNAVVIVTQAEASGAGAAARIADGFRDHVRAVETIPFDPALKAGHLRFDDLKARTRDAWLRAAAATAQGL